MYFIVYTGLRPGEKLYEELQHIGEKKIKTENKKIMILKDHKNIIPFDKLKQRVENLIHLSQDLDQDVIQHELKTILPTYRPRANLIDDSEKLEYGINAQA